MGPDPTEEKRADPPLARLALADPALADALSDRLEKRPQPLPPEHIEDLVDLILGSISLEISFGEAVAGSLVRLAEGAGPDILKRFKEMVDEAAKAGPALGKLMANHSVPVLLSNDPGLLENFLDTVRVLHAKGTHTLYEPLACFSDLLAAGDLAGARAFLGLLEETFGRDLSYGLTRHFAHALPKATASFDRAKRTSLLRQLRRVMAADTALVDAFLDGIARGLCLLSASSLEAFVSSGLQRALERPAAGRNFLSLSSAVARMTLEKRQTAVPLAQARPRLQRYLKARLGSRLSVKSLSDLPGPLRESHGTRPLVCTDGRCLYLADIMDRHPSQTENINVYQTLVRLEAAHIEFCTFDFDLQRLQEICPELPRTNTPQETGQTDLLRFFAHFSHPSIADDLFTIFEHGRLFHLAATRYPGLARRLPVTAEGNIVTQVLVLSRSNGGGRLVGW
jgi:hypothetical protein